MTPRPHFQPRAARGINRNHRKVTQTVRRTQLVDWLRRNALWRDGILPRPAPAAKVSNYLAAIALLLFGGIYTDLNIMSGTTLIPMVSALPGLALILIYPGVLSPKLVRTAAAAAAAVFVMGLFGPSLGQYLVNRTLGALQTGFGVTAGYACAWVVARLGRTRIHTFLRWFIPIYLACAAMEIVLPPFRAVVTAYLDLYHFEYDLDEIANREAGMGGYRPKLFTSETSYVSTTMMLSLIAYVWTGTRATRYAYASVYFLLGLAIIRSPIMALCLPVIFVSLYCDERLGKVRGQFAFWSTIGVISVLSVVGVAGMDIIATRASNIASGADYSTTFRTYGSLAAAIDVAMSHPLFGVGAGSLEPVKTTIINTYLSLGVPLESTELAWNKSINNALASSVLYFGFGGTLLIIALLFRLFRTDVIMPRVPVALALVAYGATYGAIYTPKFLITVMTLLAVSRLRLPPRAALGAIAALQTRQAAPRALRMAGGPRPRFRQVPAKP